MISAFKLLLPVAIRQGCRLEFSTATSLRSAQKKVKQNKKRGHPVKEELLPVVAIVGRPNVGKSALYNRLLQQKEALVKNTPDDHVTRDYRKGLGRLGDLFFRVVDTSGLEPFMAPNSIQARATQLTSTVLQRADITLFVLDARVGLIPGDHDLAQWLREKTTAPIVLAANKAERRNAEGSGVEEALLDATRLGLGQPIAISAETGEGLADLYLGLQPLVDEVTQQRKELFGESSDDDEDQVVDDADAAPLKLAIVGLPNAGKSTLVNQLLGRERSLTGPEPGLTRDAVSDSFTFLEREVDIVDTAGWLNHSRLEDPKLGGELAEEAQLQTQRSYNRAQVVLLVVDALAAENLEHGLTRRELALASKVISEGRALMVALNKLDALPQAARNAVQAKVEMQLERQLPEVQGAACIGISALTGKGMPAVMPAVMDAFRVWTQRVPTSRLNKWLVKTVEQYQGKGSANEILRLRYVTQVNSRPPTFVAFAAGGEELAESSVRFLNKSLRSEFGFAGVPLRIMVRLKDKRRTRKPPPPKRKG